MKATMYFDGSSQPHTKDGVAGWGYVLEIEGRESPVEATGRVKEGLRQSNNMGEYSALLEGLRRALEEGVTELHVIGDSQLVIYQMTGKYKVKDEELRKLWTEGQKLMKLLDVTLEWRRRKHNKADAHSRVK